VRTQDQVRDEEDGRDQVVVAAGHAEVGFEAFDLCISW
jgi:hypothetical protein